MDPVTVSTHISKPRDEVFAYLADIANHPEFCDHFLTDWHLTREESYGQGAGARFRMKRRFDRFAFGDWTFSHVEAPWKIVARGRSGKFNRIRMLTIWEVQPSGHGTDVTLTFEWESAMLSDKLAQIGYRGWAKRRWGKALRRLRAIHETGRERGQRATISGGARKPATPLTSGPAGA
ncbi:MAG: SRPBCC family protein [Solirubrobacteraceae bacterium]|nr:SRPBCC family protein [Solirubrobacteraceae bacterium]